MAKSVSIPIALSELKRVSLQRLSTRRTKKKEKPLNGFVIFVQEIGDSIKLYGSTNGLDGYDVGDEIIAVNDVAVEGKSKEVLLLHIKESIENRTIQLKVKKNSPDDGIKEQTSQTPLVTNAYVVCVDKDDVKKICLQIKQKFHGIKTFDMEEIASSKLNNITPTANNVKQNQNGINGRGTADKSSVTAYRQKENEFLRNSLRSSKKLKTLAKDQKEPSVELESTRGYDNHCYEQPKDSSGEAIPLKQVIVSVERISDHLSRLEGREEDRQLIMNFFQSQSVQECIQQTAEQHESVANSVFSTNDCLSRPREDLRVVTIFKHEDSYLGATVRNEENRIVIGRVVKGGTAEKMGLLHEGDELIEMNGVDLRGKRVDEVCEMLRQTTGEIKFLISPAMEQKQNRLDQIVHLRALFDYDPEDDIYVPCRELALKFERGDILHVLNTNDENWWQAYRDGEDTQHQMAGLIPSSSFHQQVIMYNEEVERENRPRTKKNHKRRIPEVIRTLGRNSSAEITRSADELALPGYHSQMLTYEEVHLHLARTAHKRPLVLCGPEGVGCLQLRQRLLRSDSDRLASPVPYTSRPPRAGEIDGVHYHFVSKQYFQELSRAGKFVEFGEYQKHLYGTSIDDVINVIHKGMTCILTLKPESISGIRIASVMPYIVFVAPPSLIQLRRQRECAGQYDVQDDQLKTVLSSGKQIEMLFGHLFDAILVNTDLDKTQEELRKILKRLETQPQWVPIDWVPSKTNGINSSH